MDRTISRWVSKGDIHSLSFLDQSRCKIFRQYAPKWLSIACVNGYLCVAEWLHDTFDLALEEIYLEGILFEIAKKGLLGAAQWLCSAYGITRDNIDSFYYPLFREACAYGQLSMVQWLHNTFATHNTINDELVWCLHDTCINDHLRVAKWIQTIFEFTTEHAEMRGGIIFHDVCGNNRLKMAMWLYHTFKVKNTVNHTLKRDVALLHAKSKHIHLIRWLCLTYHLPWLHGRLEHRWSPGVHATWHATWQAAVLAVSAHTDRNDMLRDVLQRMIPA